MVANTTPPKWATESERAKGAPAKYPLGTMELYEVFRIHESEVSGGVYEKFKTYIYNRGAKIGRKFKSRRLEDGTIEVCRVK